MSEKTEDPSPQKLRKAFERGEVPISASVVELATHSTAAALAVGTLAAAAAVTAERLRSTLEVGSVGTPEPWGPALDFLALGLPLVAASAAAAAVAGVVQTGGAFTPAKLAPDFSKLNPATGFQRLLSWERVVAVARALLAALLVSAVGARVLARFAAPLVNALGEPRVATALAAEIGRTLLVEATVPLLVLAMLDLALTRRRWWNRLKMAPEELKREHRENEGDPELKAARHRAHQEALEGSMLAAVQRASVVVVNPTHLATALEYDAADEAAVPRVIASGSGDFARRIVEAAHAYGVPVVRDIPVARALRELAQGDEIPEALYDAVAAILHEAWSTPTT